jgi:hypothetical protein
MKRAALVLACGVVALAVATAGACAAESAALPWHDWGRLTIAFGAGMSHYSEYRHAFDDGSLNGVRMEENDDRFHGSVGFAGRYLGAELGYETLGRVRLDATSDGSGTRWFAGRLSGRLEGHAVAASALLRAPAGDRWVSQLRLGILGWNTVERTSESGGLIQRRIERSGQSLVVGAGGELGIDPAGRFWARAEVSRSEVGEKDLVYYVVSGSVVLHY